MIHFLRKASKGLVMWIVLGAIVFVFGLSFGLPNGALSVGSDVLVRVYGEKVTQRDFQYEYNAVMQLPGVQNVAKNEQLQKMLGLKEEVLEAVIERQILVSAGEDMGLAATKKDAEDLTVKGFVIILGDTLNWLGDEKFNYEQLFKRFWLPRFQISEPQYLEIQRQEILARTVRDLLASSVTIPESVVRKTYEERTNQRSIRYVRFQNKDYEDLVDLSDEEINAYVESHQDALKQALSTAGSRFTKLPEQVHVRIIKVAKPEQIAADADAKAKSEYQQAVRVAQAKIEKINQSLQEGQGFRQLAREFSEDLITARSGGDLGWLTVEGETPTGLDAAVDAAIKDLEVERVSAPIDGSDGFYLVKVVGKRKGDVAEKAALFELAQEALVEDKGKEMARQAAQEALLKIQEGKKLSDLFTQESIGESPEGGGGEGKIIRSTGLFTQESPIPGIGNHPELQKAVWADGGSSEIIHQVFVMEDGFLIAGVEQKETGSDEDFTSKRDEIYRELATTKGFQVNVWFARKRCEEAKTEGTIVAKEDRMNRVLVYDTKVPVNPEEVPQTSYSMCERVGTKGVGLRRSNYFR